MTRKRTNDRPLLAARLRPFRRPPRPASAAHDAPTLRLNHGGKAPAASAHPVLASLAIAEAAANALHLALEVFARAIGEVSELDDLGRRCLSSGDATAQVPGIIADCARSLSAIDQAASCRDASGATLMDGAWFADLLDGMGKFYTRVTLPRVATSLLGSDGVGGRLSQVGPIGNSCGLLENPAVAMAIIRSAALWLAAERERVFRILAEVLEPLVAELEVIEANTTAVQLAGDSTLASELANVTKLHALANAKTIESPEVTRSVNHDSPNSLRIRRDDE